MTHRSAIPSCATPTWDEVGQIPRPRDVKQPRGALQPGGVTYTHGASWSLRRPGESGARVPCPRGGRRCADGPRIRCRGGAVCRIRCRDLPLCAAICRSLERKWWGFLGFGFFFEPEGRGFESLPACQFSSPRLRIRPSSRSERVASQRSWRSAWQAQLAREALPACQLAGAFRMAGAR